MLCTTPQGVGIALLLTLGLPSGYAQDWVRSIYEAPPPVDGPSTPTPGRTLSAGPVSLSLGLAGSLEYNDNVRLERNPSESLIATAALRFDGSYHFTKVQDLSLKAEIANRVPLTGPGRRQNLFTLAPDSTLRFSVYVRTLRISPFIKFRRSLDPILSPVVNRTEILDQRSLTPGVQVDLPMHEAALQLLAVQDRRSQDGGPSLNLKTRSHAISLRGVREVSSTMVLTMDVTKSHSALTNGPSSFSDSLSFGIFDDWTLSSTKVLRLGAGWQRASFSGSVVNGDVSKSKDPFWSASLDHRLRPNLSYNLRWQESQHEGVSTNFYRLQELTLAPRYQLGKKLGIVIPATIQWVRESGPTGETGRRATIGLTATYSSTGHFHYELSLLRSVKTSDLASRVYDQNRVTITVTKDL